jgi:hypothetical protein
MHFGAMLCPTLIGQYIVDAKHCCEHNSPRLSNLNLRDLNLCREIGSHGDVGPCQTNLSLSQFNQASTQSRVPRTRPKIWFNNPVTVPNNPERRALTPVTTI